MKSPASKMSVVTLLAGQVLFWAGLALAFRSTIISANFGESSIWPLLLMMSGLVSLYLYRRQRKGQNVF